MSSSNFSNVQIYIFATIVAFLMFPLNIFAYSESYYESYYEGSYKTTFTSPTTIGGSLSITGLISKGSGTFAIDHPLDPKNKLLFHSFVESPDVKNIYDGVAELDRTGEATVILPSYFEALNKDFRYQVKSIDSPAPNLYIKEEVRNNQFTIAGGDPGTRVSWQITGIRHDPFILENPIIVEVDKGPDALVEKGEYLFDGYASESITTKLLRFLKRVWYSV